MSDEETKGRWPSDYVDQSEKQLAITLSKRLNIPYASRENRILRMAEGMADLVPEAIARKLLVVPLFKDRHVIALAMADPTNSDQLEVLRKLTNCELALFVGTKTEILTTINEEYSKG